MIEDRKQFEKFELNLFNIVCHLYLPSLADKPMVEPMSSFEVIWNYELLFVTPVTFQEQIGLVNYVLQVAIV